MGTKMKPYASGFKAISIYEERSFLSVMKRGRHYPPLPALSCRNISLKYLTLDVVENKSTTLDGSQI